MSEGIAKVVRDIKKGRALDPASNARADEPGLVNDLREVHKSLIMLATEFVCPVIDATPMYEQIVTAGPIDLYGDFRMLPVWENALIGYENEFGNVYIVQSYMIDKENHHWEKDDWVTETKPPYVWETPNEVDWASVRYRFIGVLWAGGRSQGRAALTMGPIYRWDIAANEDGTMADIRWSALYDFGENDAETVHQKTARAESIHQNAMMVWLQTYTLAGCTNVELVTPQRPKPERKRLERLGVVPQTIVIKRTSKTYRHKATDTKDVIDGVPQRFVRGHYARYGPEYDRGLLFGKYAGKFWIPARAVGESDREIDYITDTA